MGRAHSPQVAQVRLFALTLSLHSSDRCAERLLKFVPNFSEELLRRCYNPSRKKKGTPL